MQSVGDKKLYPLRLRARASAFIFAKSGSSSGTLYSLRRRDGNWKVLAKLEIEKFQNLHDGNRKEVRKAKLTDFELYDVGNDTDESENLAEIHPKMMKTLKRKLEKNYRELLKDSYVWNRQIQ